MAFRLSVMAQYDCKEDITENAPHHDCNATQCENIREPTPDGTASLSDQGNLTPGCPLGSAFEQRAAAQEFVNSTCNLDVQAVAKLRCKARHDGFHDFVRSFWIRSC